MAESRERTGKDAPSERAITEARRRFLRQMESQARYDAPAVSTIPLTENESAGGAPGRSSRG